MEAIFEKFYQKVDGCKVRLIADYTNERINWKGLHSFRQIEQQQL